MQHIGLGTAAIGRPQYINIKQHSNPEFDLEVFRTQGLKVLDTAYELGIRYFDTAPGYGMAEQLLIDWLKNKDDNSIEIATKWGYTYVANYHPTANIHEIKDHSLKQLLQQWQQSKNLLPYLTTLQIHSATLDTGVLTDDKVLNQLAKLKAQYKISIGLTTTGSNQAEVLKIAAEIQTNGIPLFNVYQITYNILDQSTLNIANSLINNGSRVVVKEALANGRVFENKQYPHYAQMYKMLGRLANEYNVGIDAVALQFCLATVKPFMVLSGAAEAIQVRENLKANQFTLTAEEVAELTSFKIDPKTYWDERKLLVWQ